MESIPYQEFEKLSEAEQIEYERLMGAGQWGDSFGEQGEKTLFVGPREDVPITEEELNLVGKNAGLEKEFIGKNLSEKWNEIRKHLAKL